MSKKKSSKQEKMPGIRELHIPCAYGGEHVVFFDSPYYGKFQFKNWIPRQG